MSDYKNNLKIFLNEAVTELYSGSMISGEITEVGFHCDFDLSEPLNPEKISAISERISGKNIPCAYELSGFSGVYQDGDASKKMLQRIYVTTFETQEELRVYREKSKKSAEHDHKKLGAQLGLFSTSEEIGQGLVLWHPRGAIIRFLLEQFSGAAHLLNGYDWVYSPHIGRAELWKTSGHLENYRESMYSPIEIDGDEYYLKPMNCPFHFTVYNSETRSYRDLPIRLAEFGNVYRYELSGTLHSLTRVRGFTQDDAHIICTPEQAGDEVAFALKFSLYILRSFGLTEFQPYVSTKPKNKSIGSDEEWDMATEILKKAVVSAGLEYKIDEGGGAFYGPKIDLKLYDSLGREWQCSTIQFDFNLPERFKMKYTGSDGKNYTPVVVHRALFGSIERFFALLIEHYKGEFPLWYAPVQFAVVPINNSHNDYCKRLEADLKKRGLRVEADYTEAHMRGKIKRFETQKIPFILVIGDRDIEAGGFSVRSRRHGNLGLMNLDTLSEYIKDDLDQGKPKYILEEENVIKQLNPPDFPRAAEVIRESFSTVAKDFELTEQNFPTFTGFVTTTKRLQNHAGWGWRLYGLFEGKRMVGYASISKVQDAENIYELHNLAVLPEYRVRGCGGQLLDFCKTKVRELGGIEIRISIIEENTVLKNWYAARGFIHTGIKWLKHLPCIVGFMKWEVK